MRRITKVKRSVRAISPVIATLLMIAIAVVASLVVYAWVIGYIGGGTTKASNSMLIQSTSHTAATPSTLIAYVQNVGQGTLELKQGESVYVNSNLRGITGSTPALSSGKVSFSPGDTATLITDYPYTANEKLKIKITATDGTFAEYTTTGTSGISTGTFPTWPKASFTMSTSYPDVSQSVTFTDTSVKGTTGTIDHWSWNFGDGATSSAQNPRHSYSTTGTKAVTLTVTDTNSRTSTTTHTLVVSGFASPTASFTWTPLAPGVTAHVTFSDASLAGTGTINQWSWSFDSAHGASRGTSSSQNPSWVSYSYAGQKTVSLTVTDSNGKTSTTTRTVNVGSDLAPTAEFTMSASNPDVGQTVTFTDASTKGSTGTINQWSWDFGDSTTDTTKNPTHSYTTPGTKTITLTVTDTNSRTSTAKHTLTVNDYTPPVASFTFTPATPTIGQTVTFTDASTAGSGPISQRSWTFGDGASPATSSSPTQGVSYSSAGQKTVVLTVTDSHDKTSTTTQTVQVNSATPTPTPIATPIPINEFSYGFEGSETTWDDGWDDWTNPPWYQSTDSPHTGAISATSDGRTDNRGAFTCDPINAQEATAIQVSFWYKGRYTENGDLKLFYSGKSNPDSDPSTDPTNPNRDFTAVSGINIGSATDWTQVTLTISDSNALTSTFRFRFETDQVSFTNLNGELEQIWIDDVVITLV